MNDEQEKHLLDHVKRDEWYQQFLAECETLEPEYLRIMESLPVKDRETVEKYITIYQTMDYRETVTAYFLKPIQ